MEEFYKKVQEERKAQDKQWGGASHDVTHSARDWAAFIHKQAAKLGNIPNEVNPRIAEVVMDKLVKIGALAQAAYEAAAAAKAKYMEGREIFTCPDNHGHPFSFAKENFWQDDNTCSFCGSLKPEKAIEYIIAGNVFEPTTKSYKFYIQDGNGKQFKCYIQHFTQAQIDQLNHALQKR